MLDADATRAVLSDWSESQVEIILRGNDSDAWLARFAGSLGIGENGVFAVHIGGAEAWVNAVPLTFREAVLHSEDVLVVRHVDGQTTIRKAG